MKHFVDWCAESARLVLPIAEENAFEYLRTLTSPTVGWSFVSSLITLRHLDRLLSDVRDGRFKPDTTRSGFYPRGADERQPAGQALYTTTIEPLLNFHIRTWVAHLIDPVRFQPHPASTMRAL
eukprot:2893830-Amphidinium_carterae.1